MTRPRLLDLFCGAGGASAGYARAGFDVVGVDVRPMPRYPFEFIQGDALQWLDWMGSPPHWSGAPAIQAIHVSPTCQNRARVTEWRGSRDSHPDTLTPALELLAHIRVPWVVENVPEAVPPLRPDLRLCGSQFRLNVKRHRVFQLGNWSAYELMPPCACSKALPFMHKGERAYADAMGCTWMTKEEGRQAIPPAYTEYVGRALLGHLAAAAP
jgi:hypothetical protein